MYNIIQHMRVAPIWTFLISVTGAGVILLGIFAHTMLHTLLDVTQPCQHGGTWTGTQCDCSASKGVWAGTFCEANNCSNRGKPTKDITWSCTCGSIRSDAGRTCTACYTEDCSQRDATCDINAYKDPERVGNGFTVNDTTGAIVSGRRCNQICLPSFSSLMCNTLDLGRDGSCTGCNGHGVCASSGACTCDRGWYDSPTGEKCAVTCEEQCGKNAYCAVVAGTPTCRCEPFFFNEPACDISCPGIDPSTGIGTPCFGHGQCSFTTTQELGLPHFHPSESPTRPFAICACEATFTAEGSFACAHECPHRATVDIPCSGHGTCSMKEDLSDVTCACEDGWSGPNCDCHPQYTCSGHGTCDTDGTCICDAGTFTSTQEPSVGHFSGPRCDRCADNWYPEGKCTRYCDPNARYDGSVHVYPSTFYPGFGCWGRGACTWDGESLGCKCNGNTDPNIFCAECTTPYFPKHDWVDGLPDSSYCTTRCDDETCNSAGVCNPLYKPGDEPLCLCDVNARGMDTLNASDHCSTCQNGWYPEGVCDRFCSAELELTANSGCDHQRKVMSNLREPTRTVKEINRRGVEASRKARGASLNTSITVSCLNCNPIASCSVEGTCVCPDGVTGIECNKACKTIDERVCAGHGTCSQSSLVQWFDPESDVVQCDCEPVDEYAPEVRSYYDRVGVSLPAPPTPHYFGDTCQYHCPTYNQKLCADRGRCEPTPTSPITRCTRKDNTCTGEGVFCADVPTPWDDYALQTFQLPTYFLGAAPGAAMCRTKTCVDDLEKQDYEQVCISLLNGLYPSDLNGASCSSNGAACNQALIDAFTRGHTTPNFVQDHRHLVIDDAWGENVALVLAWSGDSFSAHDVLNVDLDVCTNISLSWKSVGTSMGYWKYGNEYTSTCHLETIERVDVYHTTTWCEQSDIIFEEANVTICNDATTFAASIAQNACLKHDTRAECILDSACIFDTSVEYMRSIDERCLSLTPDACDADPHCLYNDNLKTCNPKTFCRAITCEDTIRDIGIAPMCIPLPQCAGVEDADTTCEDIVRTSVEKAAQLPFPLKPEELYFYCWNYFQKDKPLTYTLPPPGDVLLAHADDYTRAAISILQAKEAEPAALRDGRWDALEDIAISKEWCSSHLDTRWPASSASSYASKSNIRQELPYLIVCGNNTMMAFETDNAYASQLATYYGSVLDTTCVVRSDRTSFSPPMKGLDALRWEGVDVDVPVTWSRFCDTLPPCDSVVSLELHAQPIRSTPLDVDSVWLRTNTVGLFKGASGTSIRDGWMVPLAPSTGILLTRVGNRITSDVHQATSVTIHWGVADITSTMVIHGPTDIAPITVCAVNISFAGIGQPATWSWGIETPCRFASTLYANGTIVTNPDVVDGAYVVLANNTLLAGTEPVIDTYDISPTLSAYSFIPWNISIGVQSDDATFAFELVGSNDQEALRIDVFNGNMYFRGSTVSIGTITNHVEFSWQHHALHINDVSYAFEFSYIPKEVHVYATKAHSKLVLQIIYNDEMVYHDQVYETPTRAVFESYTSIDLPTGNASYYSMTGHMDGDLHIPGVAEIRSRALHPFTVEGSSTPFTIPIRLEIGSRNSGFSDSMATHAATYTPVWTPGTYEAGDRVLYLGLTYEATGTSTSTPSHGSSWRYISFPPWDHGGRVEVIPPLAVESLAGAVHVEDGLGSSFYAGDVSFGTVYELNGTGYRHVVRATVLDEVQWEVESIQSTPLLKRIRVKGSLDAFRYVSAPLNDTCASKPESDVLAFSACGDEACDWPFVNFFDQCRMEREQRVPYELTSLLGASFVDWESFCAYAHPEDYDWSGVHYGYEWHHMCNKSDIVCDDVSWVDTCFSKTSPYASTCSSTCLDTLKTRVDGSICERVNALSDVKKLAGTTCDGEACNVDFVPRTFCETQQAYHDIRVNGLDVTHNVKLPFLETTSCSSTCVAHLEGVLDWERWEDTCAALGEGDRPGYCSVTSCDCDVGYDGGQCELQCPVGAADGEDATCSGENGFCIPTSTEAFVVDSSAQEESGETGPPVWMGGPDVVQGICQCVQGSGDDCSLKCEQSNNGTYGPGLRSQYGICDANLAAVKALPPCTRYNSDFLTESGLPVAFNSSTYDQAVLVYPERFFFCDLQTLYKEAARAVNDLPTSVIGIDITSARDAWRVLTHICWPWGDFSAREETGRKASQGPIYNVSNWYWTLENTLSLVQEWEAATSESFPVDRMPRSLPAVDRVFVVRDVRIGVQETTFAAYDMHVIVRGVVLPRRRASWAQYGDILLMYGGEFVSDAATQTSFELWRFDVAVGGVVTLDAHLVEIDGPSTALERPFAAADGVAYLWADDNTLWELDLTGTWGWTMVDHVNVDSVVPGTFGVLDEFVLRTSTCGFDVTSEDKTCVASEQVVVDNEWNQPAAVMTDCMLRLVDRQVRVNDHVLSEFEEAPTRVDIYLHDLKTMNDVEDTFELRVRQAIRVEDTCTL